MPPTESDGRDVCVCAWCWYVSLVVGIVMCLFSDWDVEKQIKTPKGNGSYIDKLRLRYKLEFI